MGCVSGSKEDKSNLFDYIIDDAGVPMIAQSPVTMVCSVEDIYETKGFSGEYCKEVPKSGCERSIECD